MLSRHIFWLKTAAVLQVLTACLHSLSFIAPMQPQDEQEKQMLELMSTHEMNGGMGFTPTMMDLLNSLSAALPALYVFGALILLHLLRKKADLAVLRGVVWISVVVFGIYFVVIACLTFPPPIICTGLVFIALLIGWLTLPKKDSAQVL